MRVLDCCATVLTAAVLAACVDGGNGGGGGGGGGGMNAAPVITSGPSATVDEGTTAPAYRVAATDADGNTIIFSISGGADAADFAINASTGDVTFVAPPDFEIPADANGDNIYLITVAASDGMAQATLAVSITVRDVAEAFQVRRRGVGFSEPLFVAGAGDASGRLFVVQKGGLIRILDPDTGAITGTAFLDVSATISTAGEQGLLGLAFAPDYATSGVFYVYASNSLGDTEIRRYTVSADPDVANAAADVILTFDQPSATNHKGGWIGFGPDGFLYIASGDGGAGATATRPSLDTSSLLGKILRIDVAGDDFPADANRDYRIPASNPFAAGGGAPEVYAIGLRNPFRASFDAANGRLIIGDVGETMREEIDVIPLGTGGQSFGWPRFEGTEVINSSVAAPNALPPVLQYFHGGGTFEGNSVTGGVVNRGPVAALQGHYIFGDFIGARIWSVPAASLVQGTTLAGGQYTSQTAAFAPDVGSIGNISSFGTDDDGNVYIVDYAGGEIFRLETP